MKTVCQENQCTGCMACVDICPKQAVSVRDDLTAYNAVIDSQLCVNCGACTRVCQQNQAPQFHPPVQWYQGWAADPQIREAGSSGGVAGALTRGFLQMGGVVCSCVFADGEFCFRIARTSAEAEAFTGSKYIKSNPHGIYPQIRQLLRQGTPVLFIGLPCQCAGVKMYIDRQLQEKLYTVDLICHGSPSPSVLDAFLTQYDLCRKDLHAPSFRNKSSYRFTDGQRAFSPAGIRDRYLISFLNTLTYTENCYSCSYARTERISDLSLGDSWGSELPAEEVAQGISLVLCQTEKGKQLLEHADLYLTDVDSHKAIASNHQLHEPSPCPAGREAFFLQLKKGVSFNRLVYRNFPKQCFRQNIKGLLYRLLKK